QRGDRSTHPPPAPGRRAGRGSCLRASWASTGLVHADQCRKPPPAAFTAGDGLQIRGGEALDATTARGTQRGSSGYAGSLYPGVDGWPGFTSSSTSASSSASMATSSAP